MTTMILPFLLFFDIGPLQGSNFNLLLICLNPSHLARIIPPSKKKVMEKTKITNGLRGWNAETYITDINGFDYHITTMKRHGGKITAVASPGKVEFKDSVTTFKCSPLTDPSYKLCEEKVRATEKSIRKIHQQALLEFDQLIESNELPSNTEQTVEIGHILFLDGYGKTQYSSENEHIIYHIEGDKFFTVEKSTLQLRVHTYVKNYENKFGIGMYYDLDYTFNGSIDEINNLVIDAKQKAQIDQQIKQKNEETITAQREEKIEKGKDKVNIPSNAKAIIVAHKYSNESDSMTDYFSTRVVETVYLQFSTSTRNNANELEKASQLFEETKDFINDEDCIIDKSHSGTYLPKYYFGTPRWSGWKIVKLPLTDRISYDEFYIAATENRWLIQDKPENNTKPIASELSNDIEIIDYSEKAIAVIGNTKPIKDILKSQGGRFNFRLKCGAGWIFPKTKKETIQQLLTK